MGGKKFHEECPYELVYVRLPIKVLLVTFNSIVHTYLDHVTQNQRNPFDELKL